MMSTNQKLMTVPDMPKLLSAVRWPSANLMSLVGLALVSTIGVMAFQSNIDANAPEIKSVAWYTANIHAAEAQNKLCYEIKEIRSTENCVNSLHALEMLHKGINL